MRAPSTPYVFTEDNRAVVGNGAEGNWDAGLDERNPSNPSALGVLTPRRRGPTPGETLARGRTPGFQPRPGLALFCSGLLPACDRDDRASRWGPPLRARSPARLPRGGPGSSDGERAAPRTRPQRPERIGGAIQGTVSRSRLSIPIQRLPAPAWAGEGAPGSSKPRPGVRGRAGKPGRERETPRAAGGELAVASPRLPPPSAH